MTELIAIAAGLIVLVIAPTAYGAISEHEPHELHELLVDMSDYILAALGVFALVMAAVWKYLIRNLPTREQVIKEIHSCHGTLDAQDKQLIVQLAHLEKMQNAKFDKIMSGDVDAHHRIEERIADNHAIVMNEFLRSREALVCIAPKPDKER